MTHRPAEFLAESQAQINAWNGSARLLDLSRLDAGLAASMFANMT
jgi:hypothetical protein